MGAGFGVRDVLAGQWAHWGASLGHSWVLLGRSGGDFAWFGVVYWEVFLGAGAGMGVPGAGLCVLELAYVCWSLPGRAKAGLGKLGLDLSRCWLAVSIFV